MDGTLVDTEPYWIGAETALAERAGGVWTPEDGLAMIGKALTTTAQQLRARAGVGGTDEEIVDDLVALVVAQVVEHGVPWRPGARELLAALVAAGVPCALVTMAYAPLAAAVVDAAPAGTFREVVTGDAVTRGKPDPEAYLTAAARLGVDPTRCVAIEDSTTGIASAEAAGCRVIGVQLFTAIPPAPGRSRLALLDQITLDDLRRVMAGEVLDLL
jgi:HAD superfamily hydrolase (TIGR01509 family)